MSWIKLILWCCTKFFWQGFSNKHLIKSGLQSLKHYWGAPGLNHRLSAKLTGTLHPSLPEPAEPPLSWAIPPTSGHQESAGCFNGPMMTGMVSIWHSGKQYQENCNPILEKAKEPGKCFTNEDMQTANRVTENRASKINHQGNAN
jgi:hypothetical protein